MRKRKEKLAVGRNFFFIALTNMDKTRDLFCQNGHSLNNQKLYIKKGAEKTKSKMFNHILNLVFLTSETIEEVTLLRKKNQFSNI
jgi:hypothetical protein